MNHAVRNAADLIRRAANYAKDPDPVIRFNARTSQCDARAALCLAKGVAIEDIDPATGYDHSEQAYERSRASWLLQISDHGATDWLVGGAREAQAKWMKRRPDLTAGDDWLAGVAKPEDFLGGN